ncbi:MAG: FecR domain-containing protein [Tannerellaceae bacterium]|jgi:ferric-dicitrate binding protein FerR (iron transport regulator)|nr:FecR domain-containing protein [Tannerellaceae bacterium]
MSTNEKNFLNDSRFVAWMLTGDEELRLYWHRALEADPSLRDDFDRAVARFGKLRLHGGALSDDEFAGLRRRISRSVAGAERRRRLVRPAYWAAAACIAALAVVSIYIYVKDNAARDEVAFPGRSLTADEHLGRKEISLITERGASSFAGDVHVSVDADGRALVRELDGGKQTLVEPAATMNKLVVPYGKRSQLLLSDGTRLWINSGSVLEFPAVFADKGPRLINLLGEIYIEVAPDGDRPFYVNTEEFQVKVHGTRFNVSAYQDGDASSVVLVDGRVSVRSPSGGETVLLPNDKLSCGPELWNKQPVDVAEYISWKDGYMLLNRSPLPSVLKRLERYYNLSFGMADSIRAEAITCTGKLYLSDNPEEVMSAVAFLSSTAYSRKDGIIRIEY